jgi:hypothetical protein
LKVFYGFVVERGEMSKRWKLMQVEEAELEVLGCGNLKVVA